MSELTDRTYNLKIKADKSGTEWLYDYIKNYNITQNNEKRKSRGVSSETFKKGYRQRNLMNNYEEGHFFRVRPFDIISDRKSRLDLGLVQPTGEDIGELVHLKDLVGNSNKHFIREIEFGLMQEYIRQNSLNRNNEPIDGRYMGSDVGLRDYLSLEGRVDIDTTRLPKTVDIGDAYVFPDMSNVFNFSDRKTLFQRYGYNGDDGYFKNVFLPEKAKYTNKYTDESVYWDYRDSYGVAENKQSPDFYINNGQHQPINSSIKFLGLGMVNNNNRIYHHFNEPTYQEDYSRENFFGTYLGATTDSVSPLLKKTREMFKNNEIGSLINRFKTGERETSTEFDTYLPSHGLSRGRNLLKKDGKTSVDGGYSNPYCRVWTSHHQYGLLNRRIRPFYNDDDDQTINIQEKYDKSERPNGITHYSNNTVLMNNGFVRISPMHDGGKRIVDDSGKQKYMFSIENLAWKDTSNSLSDEQKGPNNGRIMWFPPYNLKFNENVNVEWSANKFIGRGEQIYTYTNTERNGTLSFTLLIDHPSLINRWKWGKQGNDNTNEDENDLLRFFAGCSDLDMNSDENTLKPNNQNTEQESTGISKNPYPGMKTENFAYVVFFPNNFTADDIGNIESKLDKLRGYETNGAGNFTDVDNFVSNEIVPGIDNGINVSNKNLNENPSSSTDERVKKMLFPTYGNNIEVRYFFNPTNGIDKIAEEITNESYFGMKTKNSGGTAFISKIRIKGNASSQGHADKNITLSERRAKFMKSVVSKKCGLLESEIQKVEIEKETITVNEQYTGEDGEQTRINAEEAKIARSAFIVFEIGYKNDETPHNSVEEGNGYVEGQSLSNEKYSKPQETNMIVSNTIVLEPSDKFRYDNEYLYFANIKETDPMVFEKIVKKVRYFDPAFHSITPEGFNSRLTFLHQCTRQGPTNSVSSGQFGSGSNSYNKYAGNLAFGRAPYCVLRIGDFFNTKICITSVSIDYDNGGGIQWDLNPEGAGVQPMFANVNISFNFVGGQDITGPIERLQNAVTENYYANASIYSDRADNGTTFYSAVSNSRKTPAQQQSEVNAMVQREKEEKERAEQEKVDAEIGTSSDATKGVVSFEKYLNPKYKTKEEETKYEFNTYFKGDSFVNRNRNGGETGNPTTLFDKWRQYKPN